MKPSSVDIPLHDIKPLVAVEDHSLWVVMGLGSVSVVVIVILLYVLWNYLQRRRRHDRRKLCFKALERVSFSNSKAAAYAISRHGFCFATDSVPLQEAYKNLLAKLEPYKYKKHVEKIDDETIGYYHIYVGMIDV